MEKPENGHGHMILSYGENEKNQEDIISIITSDYLTIELAEKDFTDAVELQCGLITGGGVKIKGYIFEKTLD